MIKKMIIGSVVGFFVGEIIVAVIPKKRIITNLFGVNENFFMVVSIILIFIILFSIISSIGKGSK